MKFGREREKPKLMVSTQTLSDPSLSPPLGTIPFCLGNLSITVSMILSRPGVSLTKV